MTPAGNPYDFQTPVREPSAFYGRDDIFDWLKENIAAAPIILLHGPHRVGLTSLLYQIGHHLPPKYTPFLINLSPRENNSLATLLEQAESAIIQALPPDEQKALPEFDPGSLYEDPSSFRTSFLGTVKKRLKRKTLLLMFDNLAEVAVAGGSNQQALADLLVYLESFTEGKPRCQLILALGPWFEQALETDPGLKDYPARKAGPLRRSQANALVTEPPGEELIYDYEVIRRIWQLTAGYPYYIQAICHVLYDQFLVMGRVTEHDLNDALPTIITLLDEDLQDIWDQSTPPQQLVLSALGSLHDQREVFTAQEARHTLSQHGMALSESQIEGTFDELVERDIVEPMGLTSFRFRMDLFRAWIGRSKEVKTVSGKIKKLPAMRTMDIRPARQRFILQVATMLLATGFLLFLSTLPSLLNRWSGTARPSPSPLSTQATSSASILPGGTPNAATIAALVAAAKPTPTPAIAYMHKDGPDDHWAIYTIASNGENPTRLTDSGADDAWPAWSPDGERLAFVSERDGNKEIYVMNVDGSGQTNLTNHPADDWTPTWSPDGAYIAFSSYRDGNWEIYVMKEDGSEPMRLTQHSAPDQAPAWSPDGRVIAFASKRDDNWEIYLMNPDGSAPTRMTSNEATDFAPAWSPNGQRLAFESFRDGNMEIYAMNGDGTDLTNLTRAPSSNDHGPTWSPQSNRLAFYSNRGNDWDIYIMSDLGIELVNLTKSRGLQQSPAWRP